MTRVEPPSPIQRFCGRIFCFPCFIRSYQQRNRPHRPWKPKPIRHRSRKVSAGGEGTSSTRHLKQDQSFLFRLPPEVLLMIYEAILGGQTFHIFLHPSKKLRHVRCWHSGDIRHANCSGLLTSLEPSYKRYFYKGWYGHAKGRDELDSFDGDMVPFLQTCRKIYSESINVMYARNTFSFMNGYCGPAQFSAVILPQRLQTITSLRMAFLFLEAPPVLPTMLDQYDRWNSHIAVLRQMVNLRNLIIKVQRGNVSADMSSEYSVLAPLVSLAGIGNFEVNLAWHRKPSDLTEDHWPFRITRYEHGI